MLKETDIVINAIGIIEGDFNKVQTESPLELYEVCKKKNIEIIHISAIGAEKKNPPNLFLETKKITDLFLLEYENAKVIYPGIVIGKRAKSTQFFTEIAQFPIIPIFVNKLLPFIHISQLTELVKNTLADFENASKQIFAVSEPESMQDIFTAIKGKKPYFIKIPAFLLTFLFMISPNISVGIFNKESFKMLQDTTEYKPLFGKTSEKIKAKSLVKSTVFPYLFALLAISFIWIWSGIASLISWEESYRIMQEIGANHQWAVLFIYLGSIADILLGIIIFKEKYRKKTIVVQIITMVTYMLILTVFAPHYWLHTFGVLSKNIPLIALSYYFYREN